VNIFDIKHNAKAAATAQELLANAKQNAPQITSDVKSIADLINAKITGLHDKFKSERSLTRKLAEKSLLWNQPILSVAKKINDTLRYTYLISANNYSESLERLEQEFEIKGYKIGKIFNAWATENATEDTGYRGINLTIISSQKQKFELQLHTEASFKLKTETHGLYEELRDLKTSLPRKIEIVQIMKAKAAKVKRPKGV
jgi:hypothetical protein